MQRQQLIFFDPPSDHSGGASTSRDLENLASTFKPKRPFRITGDRDAPWVEYQNVVIEQPAENSAELFE
jgi:hypothetical protein